MSVTLGAEFSQSNTWGPVNTETLQNIALFEKCRNFLPKAREVQASGLHAWYKPISRSEDTVVVIEGKERIMMGSNNHLGLTHHPEVLGAAKAALDRYGSGCTGSRLLNGTLDLHHQLEAELAQVPPGTGVMIIVDGGYAMEGDIADVPNLLKIAQTHGAALTIDDAHAV